MENTTTDTAAFPEAIQDETIETEPPPADRDVYDEAIDCELTDEDKAKRRERLESVDREIIRLEEEKKAAAKVFTNQIKPLQAERESILQALDSGTERRMVPCYEHHVTDSAGNIVRIEVRRVDTDAVHEERAPTNEEQEQAAKAKQGSLFGDDDGGGSVPPPGHYDPADEQEELDDNFEPEPEAIAQAAEDEGRLVKTNSRAVRNKRKGAAAEGKDAE